ncbi:hypothetical protein Pint_31254 [Pistacia integerrima]|uniref:Uncharacterized protein n=1 Tax=Pistacia integerrima TaxID=434235 RepID=A0ACC0XS08_9ROSI|nr:hypothetical protein Pint_31254 [Pistacia integerrima]
MEEVGVRMGIGAKKWRKWVWELGRGSEVGERCVGLPFGFRQENSNLYLLNPNDNPGNIITQVQLKGENYDEWAWAVRTTLRAKKKYGFIDGTIKQPKDNSLELEDWWTVNSMLVSWVFDTIEPSICSTISYMENVKDLWEDIRQRFSIGNGPRVQQLRADLASCKQDGQAVITYYGRLKALWDELNNYDQIPICSCTGCKCNLTAKLERKCEEERVHQFLMGLDEEGYGIVRSNILSTKPLPNLNGHMPWLFNKNGEGHDADNYFQLIGYPEWWGNRPRTSVTGRGGG